MDLYHSARLFRSSWLHEPWFSTHTGYERLVDKRRGTSSNNMTRSCAAGSDRRQLKYRESSRQAHTDAPLAATQVNNCTIGEWVRRLTQVVRDS